MVRKRDFLNDRVFGQTLLSVGSEGASEKFSGGFFNGSWVIV